MGMTRATKERQIRELEGRISLADGTVKNYRDRADAAEARATRYRAELDWLRQAPVIDPLPILELGEPS